MIELPNIMVAPNGARLTTHDHPKVPVSIADTVATARACRDAGADGLHAHVRDEAEAHVLDAGLYRELIDEMARALPGFTVQITTEAVGRYSPDAQRALVAALQPAAVSIALREITLGQDDLITQAFFHDCQEWDTTVQHILYDAGDIAQLVRLCDLGVVPEGPLQVLLVLGRYTHGQVSQPTDLDGPAKALLSALPHADWAVCAFGPHETDCLLAAHRMGGKMRIGFENNRLNRDGRVAMDNADRVRELVAALAHG